MESLVDKGKQSMFKIFNQKVRRQEKNRNRKKDIFFWKGVSRGKGVPARVADILSFSFPFPFPFLSKVAPLQRC
jgi:hypothetical protein